MARSRVLLACLTVLLTPLAFAQNAVAPAAAQQSVSGTVVDVRDGHRIRNATVRLAANGGGSRIEPTTTDDEGRFNFAAVPAGKYNLSAVARGYFSAAYLEHEGFYTSIVTGAGLETTGLQLQLTRLGTIYGSVLDDAGEPGMNTQVSLYRVDPAGDSRPYIRAGITNTDADGRYSFKRLMPGRYFLSVNATPWFAVHPRKDQPHAYLPYRTAVDAAVDVVYPTTFYPHATRAEDARPIDIESGDEFPANLTLTPEHSLTLSIQFPPQPAGVPIQYPQIQLLRRVFGRDEYVQQSGSEFNDGVLSITGVAAGTYTVMRSPSGNSFAVPLREIDLGPDSTSMLMPAAPTLAPLTVHVHADPAITPTAQAQVQLKKKLADQYASAPLRSNGEAVINGLSPGEYTVNIIANGAQFRVKSLVAEGKVIRGNTLSVTSSNALTADLNVVPRGDSGGGTLTVEGIAQRAGKPAPGTFVLLIPALAHYESDAVRRDQTNLDGSYSFANVEPGNYILIAVDEGWKLHWQEPEQLMKYLERGAPVTVPAGGAKSLYLVPDKVNTQQR